MEQKSNLNVDFKMCCIKDILPLRKEKKKGRNVIWRRGSGVT